jgi:hypothetical protein
MTAAFKIVDTKKVHLDDLSIEEDSCAVLQLYSCVHM